MSWAPPEVESETWTPPEATEWSPPEVESRIISGPLNLPQPVAPPLGADQTGEDRAAFLRAVVNDPVGFAKAIPQAAASALEHAGAAALNIPAAMYREATGVTPKTTETTEAGMKQVDAPLPFQPGVPVINFKRKEFAPEGNKAQQLIEGLSTPGMLAAFPFGGTKAAQVFFLSQTAPGAIEAAAHLVSPSTPPEQRREAATDLLLNGLMTYGISKHLATKGEPNASSIANAAGSPEREVRAQMGEGTSLRQSGEAAPVQIEETNRATTETSKSGVPLEPSVNAQPPKETPPLEQKPIPLEGPAPEVGVGGGMSTKSLSDQARQSEANRKMQEEFGTEVAAAPDLRQAEPIKKPRAQMSPREVLAEATGDQDPMSVLRHHYEDMRQAFKNREPINIEAANKYEPDVPGLKNLAQWIYERGYVADQKTGNFIFRGGKEWNERLAQSTFPKEKPVEPTTSAITTPGPEAKPTSEWASATESLEPLPPESGPIGKAPEFPKIEPQELGAGISIPKFEIRKMTPLDVATTRHSAKMQRSESNARRAVKEIRKLAKNEDRQSAIAIWVEAGGDAQTLTGWATAARGKKFKKAVIAAQNLTPEEIALGRKVISAFQSLYAKGVANDVITNFRDNYITHIWERPKRTGGFGSGTLKQNFKFNKARTFATFFEGDQAGFTPKTLSLERIVPAYIKEMDSVIAARQFVKDMAGQLDSDGRPLAIPRGTAKEVTGTSGTATLVFPKALKNVRDAVGDKIDQSDYKTMENQPALQKWSWVAEDQAGNPIMLQADLSLHPSAYKRIQAMLGTSAIKEWYRQPSEGAAQIPKAIVKVLDVAQSEMKKSMFGLLAPFHQVQEGTHAIGHTVNPFFGIPKIDLRDPAQMDAAAHGLMLLPDQASAASYIEGSGSQSSLLVKGMKKVPGLRVLGELSDLYQDNLFHQYIPGLKFKTYEHILERNTKRFQSELGSGEVTLKDVKLLSAEQTNAAYGHLNYALLDRNPTIQHLLKLGLLAPDFFEARGRFTGQAVKGLSGKVGQEQLRAIALLAATQAGAALVLSQLLGTPYDPKHPFEVVYKGRRYAMRSVPEDIFSLMKDTRSFAYSRINPLISKGGIQYVTGLNYRGEKISALDTTEELLAGYIPIMARSIPGVRELTETSRRSPITPLQQLSGSLGMRISRFSPISETYSLANDWKDAQKLPKDKGSYPVSKYQQLRYALEDGDLDRAAEAYDELRKTMTADKITTGFAESVNHPFTGSIENDRRFRASLTDYDKEMYDLAVRTRANILNAYRYVPKK